jgi:mRNA-degrading endonuclease RelE of RelBE toxin-antitoxin system
MVDTENPNVDTTFEVNTTDSFEDDLDELLDGYPKSKAKAVFDQITGQSKTLNIMPYRYQKRIGKNYHEMPVGNFKVAYAINPATAEVDLIGVRHMSQNR